ncbi:MAG: hypothetical protein P1U63_05485 [Coxiellaceae bacterium]|nr:hypothetical protein [Coxiellaceae bacterium]
MSRKELAPTSRETSVSSVSIGSSSSGAGFATPTLPATFKIYEPCLTKHFFDLLSALINDGSKTTNKLPDGFATTVKKNLLDQDLAADANEVIGNCIDVLQERIDSKIDIKIELPATANLNLQLSQLLKQKINYDDIVRFIESSAKLHQNPDSPYQPQSVAIDILDSIIANMAITIVSPEAIQHYNAVRKQTTRTSGDFELMLGTGAVEMTVEHGLIQAYSHKHGKIKIDDLGATHKAKARALEVVQANMSKLQSKAAMHMSQSLGGIKFGALAAQYDALAEENKHLKQAAAETAPSHAVKPRRPAAAPPVPSRRMAAKAAAAPTTRRAPPPRPDAPQPEPTAIALLDSTIAELKIKVDKLSAELAIKQAVIDAAAESDSFFMSTIEHLESQLSTARSKTQQALCQKDAAKLEARKAKLETEEAKGAIAPLQHQITALQAQVTESAAKVAAAEAEMASLKQTIEISQEAKRPSQLAIDTRPSPVSAGMFSAPNTSPTASMHSPLLAAPCSTPPAGQDWIAMLKQDIEAYRATRNNKRYKKGKNEGKLIEHTSRFLCWGGFSGSIKIAAADALIDLIDGKQSVLTSDSNHRHIKKLKTAYISALSQSGLLSKSKILNAVRQHLPKEMIDAARNNKCLITLLVKTIQTANEHQAASSRPQAI